MRCTAEVRNPGWERSRPHREWGQDPDGRHWYIDHPPDTQCKKNAIDGLDVCGIHRPEVMAERKRKSLARRDDSPLRGSWRVDRRFAALMEWDRRYLRTVFDALADA